MAGVEGQGPFLPAALYQVSCRLLGCRLANMQPGSRPYAWLFSTGSGACMQVRGHQWAGTCCRWPHSAMPSPCLLLLDLGPKGLVGTGGHTESSGTYMCVFWRGRGGELTLVLAGKKSAQACPAPEHSDRLTRHAPCQNPLSSPTLCLESLKRLHRVCCFPVSALHCAQCCSIERGTWSGTS